MPSGSGQTKTEFSLNVIVANNDFLCIVRALRFRRVFIYLHSIPIRLSPKSVRADVIVNHKIFFE